MLSLVLVLPVLFISPASADSKCPPSSHSPQCVVPTPTPIATPTPTPTATPTPIPTATPTAIPTPTATPAPVGGPLNDPQPDVSNIPVPAGFAAGTMTLQQAIDNAPAGSTLNVAVNRTVNEFVQILKPLTIVFGVPGGPQLTITQSDTSNPVAIAILSDDVKLYRPKLRGIGVAVGVNPPQVSGSQGGAIQVGGYWKGGVNRIQIVNADISDVKIDGIYSDGAVGTPNTGLRILASIVARAGRSGISGSGVDGDTNLLSGDWTLARSRIHDNNTANYDPGIAAGGAKWLWLSSGLVEDNEFDHNNGRGFWTDTMVNNLIFRRNRAHDNLLNGAFIESSHYITAYDNAVWNNARNIGWGWGGGIASASSDHLEIYGNTLYRNGSGVTAVSQQRGDTFIPRYGGTVDINIHDNNIIESDMYGTAWVQDWNGVLFNSSSNNRGANNKYWFSTAEGATRYGWNNTDYSSLDTFNTTPVEENGVYLTNAQKDAILVSNGLQ